MVNSQYVMKPSRISRRSLLQTLGTGGVLLPACFSAERSLALTAATGLGMPHETPGTPKICAPVNLRDLEAPTLRRIKQIGVDHVLSGGPPIPWQEDQLRSFVDRLK